MTTSERIAAAIKGILDEDRRADRERIAELERDAAHFASVEATLSNWQTIIDDLNKQLDELTEKCAALVVENKRLADGKTPTLRIDTDMSDPQPGKLLVVRLDRYDVDNIRDKYDVSTTMSQWVGFLVETPAVEEKGPWVVYDDPDNLQINPCMGRHGWGKASEGIGPFDVRSDAVAALDGWRMGGYSKAPRVITLAEARAIEAKR